MRKVMEDVKKDIDIDEKETKRGDERISSESFKRLRHSLPKSLHVIRL